jgi:predicted  nucleic acid-binding Zn ribbon protein
MQLALQSLGIDSDDFAEIAKSKDAVPAWRVYPVTSVSKQQPVHRGLVAIPISEVTSDRVLEHRQH